jgi:hypothetical protein
MGVSMAKRWMSWGSKCMDFDWKVWRRESGCVDG